MHYAYVGTPNNRDHASNPFWGLDSQLSPGDGPREAVRMLDLVESTLDRRAICIGLKSRASWRTTRQRLFFFVRNAEFNKMGMFHGL